MDLEQNTILRDILNTLRTGPLGPGTATPQAGVSTFDRTRQMFDGMISGDWAKLGWANAYKSQISESLPGNIFGAMGLSRTPNIMTQLEYQRMSYDAANMRIGNAFGHLIAPEYTNNIQNLSQDIFANSNRFAWAGDPMSSIHGSGVGFNVAAGLGRKILHNSISDLRLSGKDYASVVQTGLSSGQYDMTKTTAEFMDKTKSLAAAVGDLTRSLHMGVEEINQSMGNLKKFGITDIAEQSRVMMQIGASAQASGLSTGMAVTAWDNAAAAGHRYGIGADAAGRAGLGNVVEMRHAQRNGIVPQHIIAMGGGVEGIAGSITNAQLAFASSDTGYASLLGGGGRPGANYMDTVQAGIYKQVKGGVGSYLHNNFEKMEFLEHLKHDPERMKLGFQQQLEEAVRRGLGRGAGADVYDDAGMELAYKYNQESMGNAASWAYAKENFTHEGRYNQTRARYNTLQAAANTKDRLGYDAWYETNTPMGKFQRGMTEVRRTPAIIADWATGLWNGNGHTGYFNTYSGLYADSAALSSGMLPGALSMDEYLTADMGGGRSDRALTFRNEYGRLGSTIQNAGILSAATIAGAAGFGKLGAGIGTLILPGVGTAIGGAIGVAGGALAGWRLGEIGAAAYGDGGFMTTQLQGAAAVEYSSTLASLQGTVSPARLKELVSSLQKSGDLGTFRKTTDYTNLGGTEGLGLLRYIKNIAASSGTKGSEAEIYQALRAGGVDIGFDSGRDTLGMVGADHAEKYSAFGHKLLEGVDATGISLASGPLPGLLKRYLTSTDETERALAKGALMSALPKGSIDKVVDNLDRMTADSKIVPGTWLDWQPRRTPQDTKPEVIKLLDNNINQQARNMSQSRFRTLYDMAGMDLKRAGSASASKFSDVNTGALGFERLDGLDKADKDTLIKHDPYTWGNYFKARDMTADDLRTDGFFNSPQDKQIREDLLKFSEDIGLNRDNGDGDNTDPEVARKTKLLQNRAAQRVGMDTEQVKEKVKELKDQKDDENRANLVGMLSKISNVVDSAGKRWGVAGTG